jgi:hypothetical protein
MIDGADNDENKRKIDAALKAKIALAALRDRRSVRR